MAETGDKDKGIIQTASTAQAEQTIPTEWPKCAFWFIPKPTDDRIPHSIRIAWQALIIFSETLIHTGWRAAIIANIRSQPIFSEQQQYTCFQAGGRPFTLKPGGPLAQSVYSNDRNRH